LIYRTTSSADEEWGLQAEFWRVAQPKSEIKKYIKKINRIECIWKLFCEKFILGVFFYYELGLSLCHRAALSCLEHNAGMEGTQNDTHRIA